MADYLKLMGIDPGKTTGLCMVWHPEPTQPLELDWEGMVNRMPELLAAFNPEAVVVERFIITPTTGKLSQQTDALEVIGMVKYLCAVRNIPVVLQTKSNVTKLASDANLKKAGWYTPGMGHAMDAARHVLYYMATHHTPAYTDLVMRDTV